MQNLTELAQQFFIRDRFAGATTGVRIVEAEPGHAICELLVDERHLNAAGVVMGGALFTLADMASSVAANIEAVSMERHNELFLSLNCQINYLKASRGGLLTATAHCVKSGRTTCLYNVDITDEKDILIATFQTTGIRTI